MATKKKPEKPMEVWLVRGVAPGKPWWNTEWYRSEAEARREAAYNEEAIGPFVLTPKEKP